MARLPAFLYRISPIGETLAAIGWGTELLEAETERRNRRLSVSTAEEAGLDLWEQDYSLSGGGAADRRRAAILAAMAGGQTLTPERLTALARTLTGADRAELTEVFGQWRAEVSAVFEGRAPEDLTALTAAVERLKPAHLAVTVVPACRLTGAGTVCAGAAGVTLLRLKGRDGTE